MKLSFNFIHLTDHLGPALGRDGPELRVHYPKRERLQVRLLDLPPVGIGVEAVITHRDLSLIRDMGSHPGDELEVVHPLHLFGLFLEPFWANQGEIYVPKGTRGRVLEGQNLYGYVTLELRLGKRRIRERSVVTDYSLYVEDLDFKYS
jgi:hypothetical protein